MAAAQRKLDALAPQASGPDERSPAADAYVRLVDDFKFKVAPLYVQQLQSSTKDHVLFASVDRAAFCLQTAAAKRDAIEAVYRPAERSLRADGIRDFELILVALTERSPRRANALAIGQRGRIRLTKRAERC